MAFLPPANEVWGKVIFSQACVKNSVHGGGSVPGGCLVLEGVCSWGVPGLGGAWWRPPGMATAAGGTHPAGIHSCYISIYRSDYHSIIFPSKLTALQKYYIIRVFLIKSYRICRICRNFRLLFLAIFLFRMIKKYYSTNSTDSIEFVK